LPRTPNVLLSGMISRRNILAGLAASAVTGCGARQAPLPPYQYPIAPSPPDRAAQGLDAVVDISRSVTVSDFRLVRQSNILAVIHKASEGGDYADTACAARRPQAEAAELLWGTYHFGTGQASGAQQAAFFLAASRPSPRTLLALDLEANENNPSNSMTLEQAEAFVQAVAQATGRLPLVYVHPTWANGDPLPVSGLSFGGSRRIQSSRAAACGSPTTMTHPRYRSPGRRKAGGSGSMQGTRVRATRPIARRTLCRASVTAIVTCLTATRPRSISSGE
jgi:Glycosyl hydrolases family 25